MSSGNKKLRVAFSGVHRQLTKNPGAHNWATGFNRVSDTVAVAVYDRKADVREQFRSCWKDTWDDIEPFEDYQRMLDQAQPDIVCIATHQSTHADEGVAAAQAGVKGIVCDKQLTATLEEADRMLGAIRDAGVPFAFGTEMRWSEQYRTVIGMLRDGAVGNVTAVLVCGVTELINHGCHFYDMGLAMAGDPEPVWAIGLVDDPSEWEDWRRDDPHGRGWVGLDNGVNIAIVREGGRRAFTVLGDGGRMTIVNEAEEAYLWEGANELSHEPRRIEMPRLDPSWPRGEAIVRDLVSAVRTGGRTACDVEETRRSTEIGFAIHASNALGGTRVSIPVENRTLRIDGRPWGVESEQPGQARR